MRRSSIRRLMAVVIISAVGLKALREGWLYNLFLLILLIRLTGLLGATVAARFSARRERQDTAG